MAKTKRHEQYLEKETTLLERDRRRNGGSSSSEPEDDYDDDDDDDLSDLSEADPPSPVLRHRMAV